MYQLRNIFNENFSKKKVLPFNIHTFHQHLDQKVERRQAQIRRKQRIIANIRLQTIKKAEKNKSIAKKAKAFMSQNNIKLRPLKTMTN